MQHAAPVVLDKLSLPLIPKKLIRNKVFTAGSAEKFPEKLLQDFPVEEVDRAFVGLRPVCQELALAGGTKFIDNLPAACTRDNPDRRRVAPSTGKNFRRTET
jgi:hypothetical protein